MNNSIFELVKSHISIFDTALMKAKQMEKDLTPEQKAERKQRRVLAELRYEEQQRVTKIAQSICPNCESKLIRGKKDKKMGYKRQWQCTKCEEIHYA